MAAKQWKACKKCNTKCALQETECHACGNDDFFSMDEIRYIKKRINKIVNKYQKKGKKNGK